MIVLGLLAGVAAAMLHDHWAQSRPLPEQPPGPVLEYSVWHEAVLRAYRS